MDTSSSRRSSGHGTGPGPGYETRDVHVRRVSAVAVALVAVIIVAMGAMVLAFNLLAAREAERQGRRWTLAGTPPRLPPEPRLQQHPVQDKEAFLAEEQQRLDSYGWVDKPAGVVRLPVQRAMELTVQRGLPAAKPASADGAAP